MVKKTYAQPTLKVVELDMADIVCQSGGNYPVSTLNSNAGISLGEDQDSYDGGANAKRRNGIWGED